MRTKIRFRLLRNHFIDLRNGGAPYQPKVRFVSKKIPHLLNREAITAVFDIGPTSEIHVLELESEVPQLPDDYDSLAPDMQAAIKAEAVKTALENRKKNREIREAVEHYAEQGVIQVVKGEES